MEGKEQEGLPQGWQAKEGVIMKGKEQEGLPQGWQAKEGVVRGQGAGGTSTGMAGYSQLQDFCQPPTTTSPRVVTLGGIQTMSQEGMLRNIQQLLQNGMAALLL